MKGGLGILALVALGALAVGVISKKSSSTGVDSGLDVMVQGYQSTQALIDNSGNLIATDITSYPTGRPSIYTAPTVSQVLVSGTEGSVATATYTPEYVAKTMEYGQELRAEALLNMGYTVDQLAYFGIGDAAATIAANLG